MGAERAPTLPDIERAFESRQRRVLPRPDRVEDLACVAIVLAGPSDAPTVCLIRRAERPSDRWSGQIAFPGGRADPLDPSPLDVAVRETREEVGLDLGAARLMGTLCDQPVHRPGRESAVLTPFVFALPGSPPALVPEPGEVAGAFWIPLDILWSPTRVTTQTWPLAGKLYAFPGIDLGADVLWGLTHRVLCSLAESVRRPLPSAGPIRPLESAHT